ncbi:gp436 family protein [Roseibium litorale]|uniref:DUF1320 family protein n=1 Tax=Roseibium litorale TaxID=2803841 RepID=A0ABR9CJ92_9HYPH|nr:phage protein Gp36 family protein [Roseibium litorale]MBD8890903.1 DUF1320 family protein [Roseibium litorale]
MAYGSVDDWLTLEKSQAHIGDLDGDGVADASEIANALEAASNEMDGWLAGRYRVPVTDPAAQPVLKVHALNIATYHLARTSSVVTEEIKDRYDASIAYLKAISKGDAQLPQTPVSDDTMTPTVGDVQMVASGRVFARDEFGGW